MQTSTHALVLSVPAKKTFAFLSDIRNLPLWAVHFCKGLREKDRRHYVMTPNGEIFFKISGDEETGVIDFIGGPDEQRMAQWPARVIALPGGRSLFIFTAINYEGLPEPEFKKQCDSLLDEFNHIRKALETGAVHFQPVAQPDSR